MIKRIKYSEREICANCQFWNTEYRYPFDAGAAAPCNKLSREHAHLSCSSTILMDENNRDKPSIISTRHTFGCNEFVRKQDV